MFNGIAFASSQSVLGHSLDLMMSTGLFPYFQPSFRIRLSSSTTWSACKSAYSC
jgi:hypothetical protein